MQTKNVIYQQKKWEFPLPSPSLTPVHNLLNRLIQLHQKKRTRCHPFPSPRLTLQHGATTNGCGATTLRSLQFNMLLLLRWSLLSSYFFRRFFVLIVSITSLRPGTPHAKPLSQLTLSCRDPEPVHLEKPSRRALKCIPQGVRAR